MATVSMPISLHARITRTAISPRLATRIFLNSFAFTARQRTAMAPVMPLSGARDDGPMPRVRASARHFSPTGNVLLPQAPRGSEGREVFMSRSLSLSACARAGLPLAVAALATTGCASGAAQSFRPVAAVRSAPTAAPPASAARTVTGVEATPLPAATRPAGTAATDQGARAGAPGPRFSPAMAYDGADRYVLLFGGETTRLTRLGDTWTWDGHRWTQLHPAHSPSPRAWAEMAYDPRHHDVVLFGGIGLADTWTWNGSDWTRATPAFVPNSTQEEGMTFFSGTGTVLMYSGNFMGPNHVYSWDGANWADLPFAGGPPPSAFQGGFSVDPTRQVVVLLAYDV